MLHEFMKGTGVPCSHWQHKASGFKVRLQAHLHQSTVHPVFMGDFCVHSIVLGVAREARKVNAGKGVGDWVKEVKGLRNTHWLLQNSHRDA